jgi:hypothetical protein
VAIANPLADLMRHCIREVADEQTKQVGCKLLFGTRSQATMSDDARNVNPGMQWEVALWLACV